MKAPEPLTLTRGRVALEPWVERHDADLLAAAQDDAIWTWMPALRPRTPSDMRQIRQTHPGQPWAVVVDGVAAGSTSYLEVELEAEGLEIGWTWYRRELWAGDVNPTCKLLLLGYAFDDLGAGRVTLRTDGLNVRSQAAIRKLGCAYDGTLRHHRRRPDGSVRDSAFFSMLAGEWPTARDRLLSRLS